MLLTRHTLVSYHSQPITVKRVRDFEVLRLCSGTAFPGTHSLALAGHWCSTCLSEAFAPLRHRLLNTLARSTTLARRLMGTISRDVILALGDDKKIIQNTHTHSFSRFIIAPKTLARPLPCTVCLSLRPFRCESRVRVGTATHSLSCAPRSKTEPTHGSRPAVNPQQQVPHPPARWCKWWNENGAVSGELFMKLLTVNS